MVAAVASPAPPPAARQGPSTAEIVWRIVSVSLLTSAVAGLAGVALQVILVVPKFRRIFDEFGTELPGLTLVLLSVPGWAWAGLAVLAAVVLVTKEFLIPRARVCLLINLLAIVFVGLWTALAVIGLFWPMSLLITKITG